MEQPVESLSRLLVREIFSALQGLLAKLNRFNEAGFFREIPADSLLREHICVTASMGGKFRKLVLLFRREVYFHISQSIAVAHDVTAIMTHKSSIRVLMVLPFYCKMDFTRTS
jgi:hypothetical protein